MSRANFHHLRDWIRLPDLAVWASGASFATATATLLAPATGRHLKIYGIGVGSAPGAADGTSIQFTDDTAGDPITLTCGPDGDFTQVNFPGTWQVANNLQINRPDDQDFIHLNIYYAEDLNRPL